MYCYAVSVVTSGGVSGLRWVNLANYTFGVRVVYFAPRKFLVLNGTLGGGFGGYLRWVGRAFRK